ncbi:HlyD family efflux transporter periplasmic adaptor subunit [Faecalibacterium sp. AM43-5AT]|jgi:HlyD family secretion protein|uniref:efflux RND transporter periplasmic adaptor subunit n=1 Tax=Faecalibacterium sp. AM43-5AT TaxID=2302957 RepID=UPI000E7187A7|nr:HlyD family efflux transporter periplasmic adaptor subunit [Faecalibacterium sp. AM43-5AT]RJV95549.1 HlyD family efflux transporter periplasmic adaptor subunit [Faecalibacterium sp. AM43-5AT]
MLRKKNSEPAQQPDAQQELLDFENPAVQPGKKDPKQFLKRNWKKITAVVCVAAVAAAVLLPKNSKKAVQASTQYMEAALERRDITNTFSGSGTISAANTYTVKSLVKGTVLTADFEVGDTIEKGTVLYTIDSSDVATSVEKAQLALEQAQRSYDDTADAQYIRSVIGGTVASIKVKAGDYVTAGQEIATVRDDSSLLLTLEFPAADASGFAVGQAAEVILNGTFETLSGTVQAVAGTDTISSGNLLVRTVTIAVKNNGSLTTAQAASATINGVSALASARFDYQHQQTVTATTSGTVAAVCVKEGTAIEANTAIVQLSGTELSRQVQSAADSLLNAQLSMSDTQKQMENYTITSPISGTVIQKNVKAGDTVGTDTTASETLCTIYDLSYLEMTLNVDELEILSIKEGQTVTITADAISDRTFTGVVTSVSAAGTTTGGTTTYPVTIRIDDTGDLLPGMNATAEIEVSSASNALAVPNGSVVRGNYVLVTKDSPSAANAVQDMTAPDGYVYVKITTGTSDNDSIEVTGGLQEGDTIAYDANAAEKQNASDSMEFMVGPGGTIAYDADAAEKQNASGSGGHGGGNGGPGGGGPGGGF